MINLTKLKKDLSESLFKENLCSRISYMTPFEEKGQCTLNAKKCIYYQNCLKDKGFCTKNNYVCQELEENLVMENP